MDACPRTLRQYIARLPAGGPAPARPGVRKGRSWGEVAEWLKAHAWKACLRETVTRVRIPLSPPPSPLKLLSFLRRETGIRTDGGFCQSQPRRPVIRPVADISLLSAIFPLSRHRTGIRPD